MSAIVAIFHLKTSVLLEVLTTMTQDIGEVDLASVACVGIGMVLIL